MLPAMPTWWLKWLSATFVCGDYYQLGFHYAYNCKLQALAGWHLKGFDGQIKALAACEICLHV
jgi:hypothetical protein